MLSAGTLCAVIYAVLRLVGRARLTQIASISLSRRRAPEQKGSLGKVDGGRCKCAESLNTRRGDCHRAQTVSASIWKGGKKTYMQLRALMAHLLHTYYTLAAHASHELASPNPARG